jgi:amino acid transporter
MPLVIISYLLANVAYFLVLPLTAINSSNTVAVAFGAKVFGPVGSLVLALIVSGSCLGALNATTFTSSRLIYTAGKEGYLPGFFSQIGIGSSASPSESMTTPTTTRFRGTGFGASILRSCRRLVADEDTGLFFTPIYSLLLNGTLTAAYVLVGEFSTLLTFYGVAGYTFYFLTVLSLIILRVREPNLERAYKTWIITPLIFCCVSLFLLSRAVFAQPMQTLVVVTFVLTGIPLYFWRIAGRDQVAKREVDGGEGKKWWQFWKWGRK